MNKNIFHDTRIAIATSVFNNEITDLLLQGALARLQECGIIQENISVTTVPGAIELPLVIQLLAKSKKYQAIICLGAVIRGETSHFDYVCEQVSSGCQKVMLKYNIPVIFGVLTTDNMEQALERVGGKHGHKGIACADTALEMITIVEKLTNNILQDMLL